MLDCGCCLPPCPSCIFEKKTHKKPKKKQPRTKALMYVFYDSVKYLPAVLLLEVKHTGRNYTGFLLLMKENCLVALRFAFYCQRS